MELLFKPDALVLKVVGRLRILGQVRGFGLFAQLAQGGAAGLGQLLLAGEDIHGQLLEILQIPVIHLIHDGHVLQKRDLVLFQLPGDAVDVDLGRGEAGLELLGIDLCLAEQARDALLFRLLERFELHEQAGELLREAQHGLLLGGGEGGKVRPGLRRSLRLGDEILFLFDFRLRLRGKIRGQRQLGDIFVHRLFLCSAGSRFCRKTVM